jgi:predicted nucleic acid-binding protein
VVIAREVKELPDEAAISTATLAELHFGVHLARSDSVRAARLRRLTEIETRLEALPIDEAVARSYGALAQIVVKAGRRARARTMDILIAATAHANGVPLYTRDTTDFDVMAGEVELRVV